MFSEVFVGKQMDIACWEDSRGDVERSGNSVRAAGPFDLSIELLKEKDSKLLFWRTAWEENRTSHVVFQFKTSSTLTGGHRGAAVRLDMCTNGTGVFRRTEALLDGEMKKTLQSHATVQKCFIITLSNWGSESIVHVVVMF